ncbi:MAG: 30S ribosomal protein S7 [Patescibacteria group bacterium]|nr:30S ribosomal protein S7 [Patescibacteria group bacterium]MDD5121059.1 30S ribosomal protein S7 [Patescibacteria group bacterium]MDD5221579.1 30S ribosomal protein S7 [Patescibacteria group bacterium]MDD5396022.1 30S ribosomal protein S7 [Patescibacteria group bacterium]
MRGHPHIARKKIHPDSKYNNDKIAKFINYLMERGKKVAAQKIVYGALDIIKEKTKQDPVKIFEKAITNISPIVEVKPRRIGGANYQVPFPVPENRQFTLASRWLINAAGNKKGRPMAQKLAEELLAALDNQGDAIKKKEDMHRMAESNRAFAHFARFTR